MSSSSSSKMTLTSLHALLTAQQAQIDALTARLDAREAAPAAVPDAPAKGKRSKKEKKPKDPDAPKRALSGYQIFGQSERAKALPEKLDFATISARWKALTKEQQDSYKPTVAAAAAEETASEAE